MQTTKKLTSSLEDYLEEIYIAHLTNTPLKGAELARKLNVSRASVSEALSKLVEKNFIKYNSYEAISLTNSGLNEAKKVYEKHSTIKDFFEEVLRIEPVEAGENACKIEHIISQNILEKMTLFTEFCKKNKDIPDRFKKEINEYDLQKQ